MKNFVKRICSFYLFWFAVNLPFVLNDHFYEWFCSERHGVYLFFMNLFFDSTYTGSWFLAALLISVLFVVALYMAKIKEWIIAIIGLACFVYFSMNSLLPESWQLLYRQLDFYLEGVAFSFICGIPYVTIGLLMSNPIIERKIEKWKESYYILPILFVFAANWAIISIFKEATMPLRIPFVISALLLFYVFPFKSRPIYKTLRNFSILIYMVHFDVIRVLAFAHYQITERPIIDFLVVLSLTLLMVSLILKLKKHKYFHWLEYAG